jgi:parvulin-like peptidyl-prolyl isomerase
MIIAQVNNYEITLDEYKAELDRILANFHLEVPTEKAKKRALEQLIDGYLLLEVAKNSGIEVHIDDIEECFVDLMLKYDSENEFQSMLETSNITTDIVKERIHNDLLIKEFVKTNFPSECDISSEKLNNIYQENQDSFRTQEMVKASHILVQDQDGESLQKIIQIRKSIKSPQDFHRIASECSDCPSSLQCGDLGYFTRGKMVKEFENAAFELEVNEISQPVKTQFGYHIIMLTERKESKVADFNEVRESLEKRLQQIDSELKLIRFIKELRSKADININREYL